MKKPLRDAEALLFFGLVYDSYGDDPFEFQGFSHFHFIEGIVYVDEGVSVIALGTVDHVGNVDIQFREDIGDLADHLRDVSVHNTDSGLGSSGT